LKRALSDLLGGVTMRDAPSLMTSLEAGKKIRGCLTCMISEALGGALESAVPRAISVGLIQTATLIHDDFVDQDTVRRGRPAVWTVEGARRAVLIGDVIFASAIKMMSDLSREDGSAVAHAIAQVSKGALHEPLDPLALAREIESGRLNDELYEKIIRLKTGILFGTACHLGAIAAAANSELKEACYRYGLRIGEAYQIADDVQEVKAHLSKRSIGPEQMMALTPALLRFAGDIRPYTIGILKGERTDLHGQLLEFFGVTAERMENEIKQQLQAAASIIEKDFPNNGYNDLARKAPQDIIKMFNES
ncbi:MAG: polyprenyl synthetase family protein, partial [Syntrophales bacterium LBB04]|nr:polyprenyl synthetase family protein [Syntrophales bacterium LBB04]